MKSDTLGRCYRCHAPVSITDNEMGVLRCGGIRYVTPSTYAKLHRLTLDHNILICAHCLSRSTRSKEC